MNILMTINFQINKIAYAILFFLISHLSIAQVEVKGLIKDSGGPVPFATIVLKDTINKLVAYDISDEDGSFNLLTQPGSYLVEIKFLGYKDWKENMTFEKGRTLQNIILERSTEELDKVVIKNRKRLIERKVDRLVFNVENSISASSGNALDALRVAPGVTVESEGIGMIGRGASRVMVEGRILKLSGEELVNFLNSISATDIKQIEVITNPPAKYEAEGSGGLINIIYKKGVGDSWKNSTRFSYNQNKYSYYTLGNNFLYSKDKIKLSASLNGNVGSKRELEDFQTNYPDGPWISNINSKVQTDNLSGRLALDYIVSKNTSIGAQYLVSSDYPDRNDTAITRIFNNSNTLDSIFDSRGTTDAKVTSHLFNAHLTTKLDTLGRSISLDLDYLDYNNNSDRDYTVNTLNPSNEFININQSALNLSDQAINNYSAKIDVEHPFQAINLSYGAKFSFSRTENTLENFDKITGNPVFDPLLSNEFEYKEDIQALYANGFKQFGKQWRMQLGFRLENTKTEGFSRTLNQINSNDYLKLFPTLYIGYQKNENNSYTFSYGRRVERPSFRLLNPFRIFTNSNTFSEGNPFLQPSFTDSFELNYNYKRMLTTNVFFNTTSNGFGTIFTADTENNVQAIVRRNFYKGYRFGIGEIFSFNAISWWESQNQLFLTGYGSDFDNTVNAIPKNGFQVYFDTYNSFSVGESTKLQLDFFYSSPYKDKLLDIGERYGLDFGVKQSFLENDLQISFLVKDIFDTGSPNNLVSEVDNIEVIFGQNYSRRYFRFSASYNFGNRKIRVRERDFGNEEEKRRAEK